MLGLGRELTATKLAGKYISAITVNILTVRESLCDLLSIAAISSCCVFVARAISRMDSLLRFKASWLLRIVSCFRYCMLAELLRE